MNDFYANIEIRLGINDSPGINIIKLETNRGPERYSKGTYGQSDRIVDCDTVYDVASITKLYTAALILRMVEDGRIKLDNKVSKYLDVQAFSKSSITIRDLLSHRVDFGSILPMHRKAFPNQFRDSLLRANIPSSSSDNIHYRNLGYIYLGYILENTTGIPIDDQMSLLFSDLGLSNTYTAISIANRNIKCPATKTIDGIVAENVPSDESARLHGGVAGNAGIFASAEDLARFGLAWLDGKVVGKKVRDEAFMNHDKSGLSPQALGWWMRLKNEEKLPKGYLCHPSFTGCFIGIGIFSSAVVAITANSTFGSS